MKAAIISLGSKSSVMVAEAMQKYFDQAISGNWAYNPTQYENNEVPLSIMANRSHKRSASSI